MNKARRSAIARLRDQLDDIKGQIEELQSEEQDYYDNMPESFQQGEKGELAEAAADALQCAVDSVDEAIGNLDTAEE